MQQDARGGLDYPSRKSSAKSAVRLNGERDLCKFLSMLMLVR
jgi:hypothetical protein